MQIPEHAYTQREATVCKILAALDGCESLLNIGMRRPEDPRNHWWLKICQANDIQAHVLEIFEPNCRQLREHGLKHVVCGDVRDIRQHYSEPFDVILWWHGPEHLEKAEALKAIEQLRPLARQALVLGCPLGDAPQAALYGNPHEEHRSSWQEEDFSQLGMQTEIVRDEQPQPHITAWRLGDSPKRLPRVALVFDDRTRPETTGTYCRRALGTLVELAFYHPSQFAAIPRSGFDLYLNIDDGMRYAWPAELRPCAWWAIDTHMDFAWSLEKARGFDFVFAAQRDGAALLRQEGIETARWLPLACDPDIHGRQEAPKEFDVCFVGNLMPGARSDLLRLIQQHFKNCYSGQAYLEEMAKIYSSSRVVFNRSVKNDVNMRVFEALASGSLLLTNDLTDNGQAELFADGKHLATYRDGHELLDKLRYYLKHDDVREKIAAAGRQEALAKHTYRHRMQAILQAVSENRCGTADQPAPAAAPASGEFSDASAFEPSDDKTIDVPVPRNGHSTRQSLPYFEFVRPELLERIPASARRVLEIGCGAGRLGEALKKRQACEVVGIELNPAAARRATNRLDRLLVGDIERLEVDFKDGSFDCLVCGDVLEHLVDPAGLLRRARRWLSRGGVIVASLPNVRNHSVVGGLIEGNWTYEPAGLLDQTHLHFFTRRSVESLFEDAGYAIEQLAFVPGPGYDEWSRQPDKGRVQLGRLAISGVAEGEAAEFFAYQFLVVASPVDELTGKPNGEGVPRAMNSPEEISPQPLFRADRPRLRAARGRQAAPQQPPKCLLLMVTYNRLEYTRLALDAALELDYPDLRIVVWDNASTDGTVEYVRQRLKRAPHAELIASPANRGVVYPMNEVWEADDDAELLAKIDNDTLVPPDLLTRLAECHAQSDRFGVLSGFHFRKEGEALAKASWIKSFDGVRILPQPYVGGCAVMMRRRVFDEIGPIRCRTAARHRPFMDSGWTAYQQLLTEKQGLINGYPWPPIHVDHMEDTRSPHCIRSEEHQQYKREERGMGLEEFTRELCVWRPNVEPEPNGNQLRESPGRSGALAAVLEPGQCSGAAAIHRRQARCQMQFGQDFVKDFEQFDFWGEPFAFARFADGERAICMGQSIRGQDGWSFDGKNQQFAAELNAALRFEAPDFYLGISDACCDRPAKEWYLTQIVTPLKRATFSNIFVNANYRRFRHLDIRDMAIVASEGGDYWVPEDVMTGGFDLDRLVDRLLSVDRPILVSAGPASCIIIHKYWLRAAKKQVIVDVGSAIDEQTKGRKTRQYQTPGTRTAELVCRW